MAASRGTSRFFTAGVLLLCVWLTGCDDSSDTEPRGDNGDLVGTWVPRQKASVSWGPGFDPTAAAITFEEDGSWTGWDGCSRLSGTFEVDGDRFDATAGETDVGTCLGDSVPYDELLVNAVRFNASGTDLEFFDGEDGLLLSLAERR